MKFELTLELRRDEEENLKRGCFSQIREDFFYSASFVEYILSNFSINEEGVKLILSHRNNYELNYKMIELIMKKYNLLLIPQKELKATKNDIKIFLYFYVVEGYTEIHPSYFFIFSEEILNFFGTIQAIKLGYQSERKWNVTVPKPSKYAIVLQSKEAIIAKMQNLLQNEDGNKRIGEFLNSSELDSYWSSSEFVQAALSVLAYTDSSDVGFPIQKIASKSILDYAKREKSDYIWALCLYNQIDKQLKISDLAEILVAHVHNDGQHIKKELICAYQTGTYQIAENFSVGINSFSSIEKIFKKNAPTFFKNLTETILADVENSPQKWGNSILLGFGTPSQFQKEIYKIYISKIGIDNIVPATKAYLNYLGLLK